MSVREWSDDMLRVETRDQGHPLKAWKAEAVGDEALRLRAEVRVLKLRAEAAEKAEFKLVQERDGLRGALFACANVLRDDRPSIVASYRVAAVALADEALK